MPRRALPSGCSTDQYFGSPTTPVNSQGATSIRFPGPSLTLGSVGRRRVYSEHQADVKRNFRLREQKIRAPTACVKADNAVIAQFTIEYRPEHRNPTRQEVKACPKLLERSVSPFLDSAKWVVFSCRHFAARRCCSPETLPPP